MHDWSIETKTHVWYRRPLRYVRVGNVKILKIWKMNSNLKSKCKMSAPIWNFQILQISYYIYRVQNRYKKDKGRADLEYLVKIILKFYCYPHIWFNISIKGIKKKLRTLRQNAQFWRLSWSSGLFNALRLFCPRFSAYI